MSRWIEKPLILTAHAIAWSLDAAASLIVRWRKW